VLRLLAVQEGLDALAAPADDLGIVGRVDELPPERLRPLAPTLASALAAAALALASALASSLGPSGALTLLVVVSVEPRRHRARVATTLATTAAVATSTFEAATSAAFEATSAAFEAATAAFEAASTASAANPTAAASAAFLVLHAPVKV